MKLILNMALKDCYSGQDCKVKTYMFDNRQHTFEELVEKAEYKTMTRIGGLKFFIVMAPKGDLEFNELDSVVFEVSQQEYDSTNLRIN